MKDIAVEQRGAPVAFSGRKKRWTTKDILVSGMIGIVFAFVQLGLTYAFMAAAVSAGPVVARLLNGFFFLSGFMALAIVRKPGIGLLSQTITGLVMTPLTPFGILMLFGCLINGVLTELMFVPTRYRKYSLPVFVIGMGVISIVYTLLEYGMSGYGGLAVGVQVGIMAVSAISGAFCGWLCKRLVDALMRTGLLSGYAAEWQSGTPR